MQLKIRFQFLVIFLKRFILLFIKRKTYKNETHTVVRVTNLCLHYKRFLIPVNSALH
jgi:hypothetical protein